MAKSARFDNAFLGRQIEKRKKWKQAGVRAGHGGEFNINSALTEINRSVSGIITPPDAPAINIALMDTADLPEWLVSILQKDNEVARAATQKRVSDSDIPSPHKRRLGQCVKSEKERNDTKLAEHWLQVRLFYTLEVNYPKEYEFIFAIPNGGHRTARAASLMMYEGQKGGTPDIFIPIPRGSYHGMFLEVKTDKGNASAKQKVKLALYERMGYYTVVAKGFDACVGHLERYFFLPDFDNKTNITK